MNGRSHAPPQPPNRPLLSRRSHAFGTQRTSGRSPSRIEAIVAKAKLTEYERKRSFDKTPEPGGKGGKKAKRGSGANTKPAAAEEQAAASGRFVIQEHHARRLHWDLRLEHDGVA